MIEKYLTNPKVVFEVGVGSVDSSRSRLYWGSAECHLFEPVKEFYNGICSEVIKYDNVYVHNVAIYDKTDELTFWISSVESFIDGINSPLAQQNYLPLSKIPPVPTKVSAKMITEFDKGDIDLLLLDMEGAEWFALKHLVSRPKVIVVEMFVENPAFNGGVYRNAYTNQINEWMKENNYISFGQYDADIYWYKAD